MGKKLKISLKHKEPKKINGNLNLSSINSKTRQRLNSTKKNDLTKLNTTVIFTINSNPLFQEEFEKEYHKRYLFYIKEEFNSKVLTMFFNYLSISKIIPSSFKNNRYFLKEFIKIIFNLLINEIDFVVITLFFDNMGWIPEGSDPWKYIYYICLKAKEKVSSEKSFSILFKILEKNNSGFTDSYNRWASKINGELELKITDVAKANERFRELMKPVLLAGIQKKFINYNEIVNKIVETANSKTRHEQISKQINMPVVPMNPYILENYNNESQQNIGLQPMGSFNERDLSILGSKQNSFMGLNLDADYSKMPSMMFNNK